MSLPASVKFVPWLDLVLRFYGRGEVPQPPPCPKDRNQSERLTGEGGGMRGAGM